MSATTALLGGMSIIGGASDMVGAFGDREVSKAKNNADSALQIADVYSKASSSASQMRINAMGYDNDATNIRRQFSEAIRDYDEKSAAEKGALKTSYASSGVALSGSALDVIAATENSAARRRLARQNASDSDAMQRESMASALRLNAKFALGKAYDDSLKIKLNAKFANDASLRSMHSDIAGSLIKTGSGLGKAALKGESKNKSAKSGLSGVVINDYDDILMA